MDQDTPLSWQKLSWNQKRKWKYSEGDISTGTCYDCGLWYGCSSWVDAIVPNDVWELINPSEHEGSGLLCFNCMTRRVEFLGCESVPISLNSGPWVKEAVYGPPIT